MTKEQGYVKAFMEAAGQEVPSKPTIPDGKIRKLRARLILEESIETANALGISISILKATKLDASDPDLWKDKILLRDEYEPNLAEIADGCGDIQVVTLGTTLACGIDQEPIDEEISRSNLSKFIDGYKDEETGKWQKGPSYSPANLKPILDEQSK